MVEVVWVLNLARPVKFSFTDFDRSGSCATQTAARSTHRSFYTHPSGHLRAPLGVLMCHIDLYTPYIPDDTVTEHATWSRYVDMSKL